MVVYVPDETGPLSLQEPVTAAGTIFITYCIYDDLFRKVCGIDFVSK
jgi:hypothetical protein